MDLTLSRVQSCIENDENNSSIKSDDHSSGMDVDPISRKVKRKKREHESNVDENSLHQTKYKVMKLFTTYSCYLFHDFISPTNICNCRSVLRQIF